jgi:hypothetical protein
MRPTVAVSGNPSGGTTVGMSTYLAAACGTPQRVQIRDPRTGEITTRSPRIVTNEHAPRDHDDALKAWRRARHAFRDALTRSEKLQSELEAARTNYLQLPSLELAEAQARNRVASVKGPLEQLARALKDAKNAYKVAHNHREAAEKTLQHLLRVRPGFLARLCRTRRYRDWRITRSQKQADHQKYCQVIETTRDQIGQLEQSLRKAQEDMHAARSVLASAIDRLVNARQSVDEWRTKLGTGFIDGAFFERDHPERQRIAPWFDELARRARDELFHAAMAIHKAFIDAAAKPIRHNLGTLMSVFSGRQLAGASKQALLVDLWASLFVVVPVVSTTFASVERMLGKLPPESLG